MVLVFAFTLLLVPSSSSSSPSSSSSCFSSSSSAPSSLASPGRPQFCCTVPFVIMGLPSPFCSQALPFPAPGLPPHDLRFRPWLGHCASFVRPNSCGFSFSFLRTSHIVYHAAICVWSRATIHNVWFESPPDPMLLGSAGKSFTRISSPAVPSAKCSTSKNEGWSTRVVPICHQWLHSAVAWKVMCWERKEA